MGISYNTSIVRNGLVLHLDAANVKSYPGSGTTWTDLSKKGSNASFTSLQVSGNYVDFNQTTSSLVTFPETPYTSWSIFYAAKPTGVPASNYRNILIVRDVSGNNYFLSDTREVATPNILHYIKDFSLNSWWTRQMLSVSDYATSPWKIYAHTQTDLVVKNYKNGVRLYTDTITQNLTGYGNLNRLHLNPSSSHVINLGFVMIYNRPLTDAEVALNTEALRGRYGI